MGYDQKDFQYGNPLKQNDKPELDEDNDFYCLMVFALIMAILISLGQLLVWISPSVIIQYPHIFNTLTEYSLSSILIMIAYRRHTNLDSKAPYIDTTIGKDSLQD